MFKQSLLCLLLLTARSVQAAGDYEVKFKVYLSAAMFGKKFAAATDTPDIAVSVDATRALFVGDSITARWPTAQTQHDAAVGGTRTAAIAAKFVSDVQQGSPAYVHILAGTNDFSTANTPNFSALLGDVDSMISAAHQRRIPVIVGTVLPMDLSLSPNASLIPVYNAQLVQNVRHRAVVADYYDAMITAAGVQNSALFVDGVHPNADGYAVMNQVLSVAEQKLQRRQERRMARMNSGEHHHRHHHHRHHRRQ